MLRGGGGRPNYDSASVAVVEHALHEADLPNRIVIDCSHANTNKNYAAQPLVVRDCAEQVINGNQSIIGLMLESNLGEGNQKIPADRAALKYGVSVTDGCIDWDTTALTLREVAEMLQPVITTR